MLKCGLFALSLAASSYAWLGPEIAFANAPPLPMPATALNRLGGTVARVDARVWQAACRASELPDIFDPSHNEFEPVERLVDASRRWSETRDGDQLGRMGEILLAIEQHEGAIDLFAAALQLGSRRARWAYFLGAENQLVGRTDAARRALELARELDPNYGTTHARLGQLAFDDDRLDEAERAFERCSRLPHVPSLGFVGLARVALAKRDPRAALDALDRSLRVAPNDHVAHQLRSQAFAELGRADLARKSADIAARLPHHRGWLTFDPWLQEAHAESNSRRSLQNQLQVARSKGDVARVANLAEELARRTPLDAESWSLAAAAFTQANDPAQARRWLARALELDPHNLSVRDTATEVELACGDHVAAEKHVDVMLTRNAGLARTHQLLARVRYTQQRFDEALISARRAVAIEPQALEHRAVLIEVLLRTARVEEAAEELRAYLAKRPDDAWALSTLETLRSTTAK